MPPALKAVKVDLSYFRSAYESIRNVKRNIHSLITIEPAKLEYVLAAKIAGGHVILADSHGVGKTSLARALSASISWPEQFRLSESTPMKSFSRIQCTVDLLPQDILGFSRFDISTGNYSFNAGPIFAHFVLCDEINLLTPKTQGSFLQAMEEQKVTIEGSTYSLADPFFIIATMNLRGQHLFPLPAPQLDRFMIQLSMGYPPMEDEVRIIQTHGTENSWEHFTPVAEVGELLAWQKLVDAVSIKEEVIRYIVAFIRHSRNYPGLLIGLSPRAGIKMSRLARALSLVRGENYVSIDTVKELLASAFAHRLILEDPALSPIEALQRIEKDVRV